MAGLIHDMLTMLAEHMVTACHEEISDVKQGNMKAVKADLILPPVKDSMVATLLDLQKCTPQDLSKIGTVQVLEKTSPPDPPIGASPCN